MILMSAPIIGHDNRPPPLFTAGQRQAVAIPDVAIDMTIVNNGSAAVGDRFRWRHHGGGVDGETQGTACATSNSRYGRLVPPFSHTA